MISLNPPPVGIVGGQNLHLPALYLGEPGVHPEQVRGKEGRLFAPSPGPDLQDDVLVVVGVLGQEQDLDIFNQALLFGLEAIGLLGGQFPHLRIGVVQEVAVGFDLLVHLLQTDDGRDQGGLVGVLLGQRPVGVLVGDDVRLGQLLLQAPVVGLDIAEPGQELQVGHQTGSATARAGAVLSITSDSILRAASRAHRGHFQLVVGGLPGGQLLEDQAPAR